MTKQRIEYDFDMENFIDNIRSSFDGGRDMTLRQLEDVTGISASSFSRWQNGKMIDMESFMHLCALCDLPPSRYFVMQVWELKSER